ncbi:hypothetical protein Mx8p03 [Myxococcus phage Mx8]|uniref:p3 n=1 Tax=Myxococcus phage Mx8 TaxID=49964 RepID=O03954_9CAUD|nr:hypothetical protein Mx8p03 [Myxococcus phage Mx8]AAC48898.1 unknown [Myxococcus phage Mx8]AAK94338.1 p3 [Myxococcus phage Mx8]
MSKCKHKGGAHALLCASKVNKDPITKDNPALVAYITLVFAHDLEQEGMPEFSRVAAKAGTAMALEYGRLPPGLYIPPDVWDEVYESVRKTFVEEAMKAAPTKGSA